MTTDTTALAAARATWLIWVKELAFAEANLDAVGEAQFDDAFEWWSSVKDAEVQHRRAYRIASNIAE